MQTARRHDPTKDAKFHVSIATTEEVRRKWATPRPEWTGPKGTVQPANAPDESIAAETVTPTQSGDATIGLSPVFEIAGRSRTRSVPRLVVDACLAGAVFCCRGASAFRTVPSPCPKGTVSPRRVGDQPANAPDEITKAETVTPTQSGDATIGLSPAFEIAGRSRSAGTVLHADEPNSRMGSRPYVSLLTEADALRVRDRPPLLKTRDGPERLAGFVRVGFSF